MSNERNEVVEKPPTLREALEQAPTIFQILARPTSAYQHWFDDVRRKALEAAGSE